MNSPLRIALVGCGSHSRDHHAVPLARYARQHPDEVALAAACDLDEQKAESFCAEFGFGRSYTDVENMLAQEDLDGCVVVMPALRSKAITRSRCSAGAMASVNSTSYHPSTNRMMSGSARTRRLSRSSPPCARGAHCSRPYGTFYLRRKSVRRSWSHEE